MHTIFQPTLCESIGQYQRECQHHDSMFFVILEEISIESLEEISIESLNHFMSNEYIRVMNEP